MLTITADDLSDVTVTDVANNDILQWNGSAWVNKTLSSAGLLTTETDPVVKAVVGIVKSDGTTIAAAVAGDFPTLNQNTTGNAATATATGITDDVTTATAVYPTWVNGATGDLAQNVSSTKLSLVPSTGILTATGFVGNSLSSTGNADILVTTGSGKTILGNMEMTGSVIVSGFRVAQTLAQAAVTTSDYIIDLQIPYSTLSSGSINNILPDPATVTIGRIIVLRNSSGRTNPVSSGTYTFVAPDVNWIVSLVNSMPSNVTMTLICDGTKWIRIWE